MSTITNDFLSNEVTRAIEMFEARIAEANLTPEALAQLEDAATLDSGEVLVLGPIPTRAHQAGLISLAGAQALHAIQSEFRSCSLAQRMVFIGIMGEVGGKC